MNFTKITDMGKGLCRNLCLKEYPVTPDTAWERLNAKWTDVASSCYVRREEGWLDAGVDLSVILPTYNDAAHICRSVDSVLRQETEFTFEVVVINDGSADETAQMLKQYEKDPRVVQIHQENSGHSGARNAGLKICRGQYILFHDSDDTLLPGAIQNLLSCAFSQDADVVAGGYLEETPEGERYPGLRYPEGEAKPGAISGMTCGKVYRRKLFENLCFPMGYWYEDSIIAQIILPMAKKCWGIGPEVFAYLQNAAGVSASSQGKPKSVESLYITRALLNDKKKFGLLLDEDAYEHFLYMVLLTYHRTNRLDGETICGIFQGQRWLKNTFFSEISNGSALEKILISGNYRKYLRYCETEWIRQRLRERRNHG